MPVTINGSGAISGLTITTADLVDGSVTTAKIADGAVATVDIANSAVTTAKIADANVTAAKIATGAAASNLGNYVSGITASTGISASASTGSVTLTNTGVTSVNGQTGAVTVGGLPSTFNAIGTSAILRCTYSGSLNVGDTLSGAYLFTATTTNPYSYALSVGSTTVQAYNVVNNTTSFLDPSNSGSTWTSIGSGTWLMCGPLAHQGAYVSYSKSGYPTTYRVTTLLWRRIA